MPRAVSDIALSGGEAEGVEGGIGGVVSGALICACVVRPSVSGPPINAVVRALFEAHVESVIEVAAPVVDFRDAAELRIRAARGCEHNIAWEGNIDVARIQLI